MLTIHCYVCGKDESLKGRPGVGDPTPLERFKELHAHARGCGMCRFTCPCGDHIEFDHNANPGTEAFSADVSRIFNWSESHKHHMDAADGKQGDEGWTKWIN